MSKKLGQKSSVKERNNPVKELEKVFLRKNIVAVLFFQNCAIHAYTSYKHEHMIFSIYSYTRLVNIYCYFNCTDRFRPEI